MGVGDLRQSGLRDDYSVTKWAQHKLRYKNGAFVNSSDGHRVTWAIFNETLLEIAKSKGRAYHKSSDASALTKVELRDLVTSREDLVKEMASFGADIPTTPMFWKKETNRLQWIVRQMSWAPPWIVENDKGHAPDKEEQRLESSIQKNLDRLSGDLIVSDTPAIAGVVNPDSVALSSPPVQPERPDPRQGLPTSPDVRLSSADEVALYETLWFSCQSGRSEDMFGYGRSPAFWYTLNCPYNYLHEIHRFQKDERCLDALERESRDLRFRWSLDNPDILCQLHAIRVELIIRMVMPAVVPPTPSYPFQYWARFEEGYSGNPHAHGIAYGPFNPSFDNVVKDEDTRARLQQEEGFDGEELRLWDDVTACLLYTSPSPRDKRQSRMPSSA